MKHKKNTTQKMKKYLHAALALLLAAGLTACAASAGESPKLGKAQNLLEGVKPQKVESRSAGTDFRKAQYDYDLNILKACVQTDGEHTMMVSPLSLELALAMAANGAEGETLEQLLGLFGASSTQELNETLHSYVESLGKECKTANSIWLRDGEINPTQEFLQTNADYYDAEIYRAPFDESTVTDINDWVKQKTDGMIEGILDRIAPDNTIYLLNAVCFDAKWRTPYEESDVEEGTFMTQSGENERVQMMCGEEYSYFADEKAQGFVKDYEDADYRFAAIRPNDGVDLFDYLKELDGTHLQWMLTQRTTEKVLTKIPEFKTKTSVDMVAALKEMGITAPFTKTEFTGIEGESGDTYNISEIRQKTFIEVDPKGTRAAAVTELAPTAAAIEPEKPHTVYLDRPFLYLILDGKTSLPVFLGIVTDPVADCGMP